MKILDFFLFLRFIFALLDPDPDPATQINADPCGSGSETLIPDHPRGDHERQEELSNRSCSQHQQSRTGEGSGYAKGNIFLNIFLKACKINLKFLF
jgi:hypothetical protein